MQIIPAIDIMEGKCVRLTEGNFSQKKIYNQPPLEAAKAFEDTGLIRLHLVDLEGAKSGAVKNWKVLESISGKTKLQIDFGGGIKTEQDVRIVFDSGAAWVNVSSMAVSNEAIFLSWLKMFGAEKFILGADVREEKITINGWQKNTGIIVFDFIEKYINHGIKQAFCTDVKKDGNLQGPAVDLYKTILEKIPKLFLIASGGVSSMDDIEALSLAGCKGAIIGKAIYEGRITLQQLYSFIKNL